MSELRKRVEMCKDAVWDYFVESGSPERGAFIVLVDDNETARMSGGRTGQVMQNAVEALAEVIAKHAMSEESKDGAVDMACRQLRRDADRIWRQENGEPDLTLTIKASDEVLEQIRKELLGDD